MKPIKQSINSFLNWLQKTKNENQFSNSFFYHHTELKYWTKFLVLDEMYVQNIVWSNGYGGLFKKKFCYTSIPFGTREIWTWVIDQYLLDYQNDNISFCANIPQKLIEILLGHGNYIDLYIILSDYIHTKKTKLRREYGWYFYFPIDRSWETSGTLISCRPVADDQLTSVTS